MARFNYFDYTLSQDPEIRESQEKLLKGEELAFKDKVRLGRDQTLTTFEGYDCKPDHAYRAIGKDALQAYLQAGVVVCRGEDYSPEGGNAGVDWFLGAVGPRYVPKKGGYVIECPADERLFVWTTEGLGRTQSYDPRAKHLKSGGKTPVPLKHCRIMSVEQMKQGNFEDVKEDQYPFEELPEELPEKQEETQEYKSPKAIGEETPPLQDSLQALINEYPSTFKTEQPSGVEKETSNTETIQEGNPSEDSNPREHISSIINESAEVFVALGEETGVETVSVQSDVLKMPSQDVPNTEIEQ